ncbi:MULTISPECIES: hypothetical protein [unclassified Pseudoalteromonas]|uniref:hypothetical protein n=1 Tax=unclassified Pseudoalteromonas TaxID=194690 RepID=UPI0011098201|nr:MULTISPECIES: hypothetical protein [unclassified Pseudoalteromonas]TMN68762.1 hypothetical protein CWB85_18275 [Pseudoalteromonas sp. S1727]BDF95858.1 hypothetical protein KAN5_26960 [Pseudoalteromonas sp. KAN5]
MRAYALAVIFISACHVYFSASQNESPLSFLFLFFVLSPFLPYVWKDLSNIKFDKNGLSLEKLKGEVDKTIKQATHRKAIEPKALDGLFKTVDLNEWMTLVLARMLMRQGLVCLVPEHGFGPSPSLSELIPLCQEKGLISEEEQLDLEKLRNVTFYAEWWDGDAPTHGEWQWALDNCKSIVRNLFNRQPIT